MEFSLMEWTFRESDKSLNGVSLKIMSLTHVLLVLWYHPGFEWKRWQV